MDKSMRILIVDDDQVWADWCARELGKRKLQVDVSYEVNHALERLDNFIYDIIFCDIKMRYADAIGVSHDDGGFIISGRAKNYQPQAKIIMVTAYDSSEFAVRSLQEEKSYYYLVKTDPDLMMFEINKLISRILKESTVIAANPFFAQAGQPPKFMIANRQQNPRKEMDFLLQCIHFAEQKNLARFLVLGRLGSGKSCLLMHFKRYLQKKGYLASYYKIPPRMSEKSAVEVVGDLLLGIIDGFPILERTDFTGFMDGVKKIGVKVSAFFVQGQLEWERKETPKEVSFHKLLDHGIKDLIDDLSNKTNVSVILLDDLHNLKYYPDVLSGLLEILSKPKIINKPIIFGGSCLAFKDDSMDMDHGSGALMSRFFSGNIFTLANFTLQEVSELVLQTLSGTGVRMNDDVIEMVYKYTLGHPYTTQLILHNLYENQINGLVSIDSFPKAWENGLHELLPFLRNVHGLLSKEEEIIASRIAASENGLDADEIKYLLVKEKMDNLIVKVNTICKELENRNIIIENNNKKYEIKDLMFKHCLNAKPNI
jgi:DNA-binding response OmpR family regulator